MTFGEKLKYVREKQLISQEQLAHEIGVSFSTINRLERGHTAPNLATRRGFQEYCERNGIIFVENGKGE